MAPLAAMDTCLCMGGGITVAQGIKKAEIFRISKTQNLALDRVEYYTAEDVTQIVSAEPYDVLFIRLTNVTSL